MIKGRRWAAAHVMGVCFDFSSDGVVRQSSVSEWRGGEGARVKVVG